TFEQGLNVAANAGVKNAYTLPPLAWAATAHRKLAQFSSDATPRRRATHLARAGQCARAAIRAGLLCRNDVPRAYREYALVLAAQGKIRRARKMFARSIYWSEKLGERLETATTLRKAAAVGREAGWREAYDFDARGLEILTELELASQQTAGEELRR